MHAHLLTPAPSSQTQPHTNTQVTVVAASSVLLGALLSLFLLQTRPVYLVDFAVYKPPERCARQLLLVLDCLQAIQLHFARTCSFP